MIAGSEHEKMHTKSDTNLMSIKELLMICRDVALLHIRLFRRSRCLYIQHIIYVLPISIVLQFVSNTICYINTFQTRLQK